MTCGNCNSEVPNGARYCPHCGKPLGPRTCPSCGTKLSPGFKFCPKCGSDVSATPSRPISDAPARERVVEEKPSVMSWRLAGSILTLFWGILFFVLMCTVESSPLAIVLVIIRIACGVAGIKAKSKAPAVILLLDITIHMIFTFVSINQANSVNAYYNMNQGLPLDYMEMGYLGTVFIFALFYIPAFMMLVTPRRYRVEEPVDDAPLVSSSGYATIKPRGAEVAKTQEEVQQKGEEPVIGAGEWKCPNCGSINKDYCVTCVDCLRPRPRKN